MRLYQDYENRAYSGILTSLFPEQTKTLPRILVWSVILLLDLILVVAVTFRFGLLGGENRRGAGAGRHHRALLASGIPLGNLSEAEGMKPIRKEVFP